MLGFRVRKREDRTVSHVNGKPARTALRSLKATNEQVDDCSKDLPVSSVTLVCISLPRIVMALPHYSGYAFRQGAALGKSVPKSLRGCNIRWHCNLRD